MNPHAPRVTLKDIAKRAGLSVIAVSMALRDHPRIAGRTRERVQALARQMGYRRDPLLSALSAYRRGGNRTDANLVYLVAGSTPDAAEFHHPYQMQMWEGAQREAQQLGYSLSRYWLDPAMDRQRHTQILEARGIVGLLIAPLIDPLQEINLDWVRFCVVALGRSVHSPFLHAAVPNQFGGLHLACVELQKLGYTRIGLAIPRTADALTEGRYAAALMHYQASIPRAHRVKPLWEGVWEEAVYRRWLNTERPDAVLAFGDAHYWWLVNSGRQVPRDVGYVLLSNEPLPSVGRKCTALEQNFADVGAAGVSLLHTQCITHNRGVPAVRMSVVVDGTWVAGETTRRAA